jgi:hypothetical protein
MDDRKTALRIYRLAGSRSLPVAEFAADTRDAALAEADRIFADAATAGVKVTLETIDEGGRIVDARLLSLRQRDPAGVATEPNGHDAARIAVATAVAAVDAALRQSGEEPAPPARATPPRAGETSG